MTMTEAVSSRDPVNEVRLRVCLNDLFAGASNLSRDQLFPEREKRKRRRRRLAGQR
jgi:hypothetical protein